jgi:hypothetical protein
MVLFLLFQILAAGQSRAGQRLASAAFFPSRRPTENAKSLPALNTPFGRQIMANAVRLPVDTDLWKGAVIDSLG